MTQTIPQGLSLDPPPCVALVEICAVIKNTSGAPVASAWRLSVMTAAGVRSRSGPDLPAVPGRSIDTPIVPFALAAGSSLLFSVTCLVQFPKALSGAQFAFAASAIQVKSRTLVQLANAAFRPSATYPDGCASAPLPSLYPTNPSVLIPPSAPPS